MKKEVKIGESKKEKIIKKRISWVIFIVFFMGLLIGFGGAISLCEFTDFSIRSNKTIGPKEDNEEKESTKIEENADDKGAEKEELSSKEQKELMSLIDKLSYIDFYNKNVSNMKTLDNQELMWLAISMMDVNFYEDDIDGKEITDLLNEILVENELEFEDLYDWICDTPYYKYSSTKNILTPNKGHLGHGGGTFVTGVINSYGEGYKIGDEYTISVYKMFDELVDLDIPTKFYATYNDAKKDHNPIYDVDFDDMDETFYTDKEKILEKIETKKLVKHTYVFVKDDNFKLKSYKIG